MFVASRLLATGKFIQLKLFKTVKTGNFDQISSISTAISNFSSRNMPSKILYRKIIPSTDSQILSLLDKEKPAGSSESAEELKSVGSKKSRSPEAEDTVKVKLGEETEIKGVIFDMDGTLTIPVLRFIEMRDKLGLKPTDDILPTVQKMPPDERAKAFEIIEEFEKEGVKNMKLQPGVLELFHFLSGMGIKRALMTRNAWPPTHAFLDKLGELLEEEKEKYPSLTKDSLFSKVITREFEPCKPHPAAVFEVCKGWNLEPKKVAFVGDDKTDMLCGLRAETGVNILLRNERNEKQIDYSHFAVNSLTDIITLMSSIMTVPHKQEEQC